ncbi:hypothetical protein VTK73DRAFT_6510 [Phialemonium thermophilum]|uniref:Uncharacterized protein n=1 Tax=Phialemonium thermophilum TaxID=223376 RepID=A0ABR3UZ93_9PEZI
MSSGRTSRTPSPCCRATTGSGRLACCRPWARAGDPSCRSGCTPLRNTTRGGPSADGRAWTWPRWRRTTRTRRRRRETGGSRRGGWSRASTSWRGYARRRGVGGCPSCPWPGAEGRPRSATNTTTTSSSSTSTTARHSTMPSSRLGRTGKDLRRTWWRATTTGTTRTRPSCRRTRPASHPTGCGRASRAGSSAT